MDSEMGDAGRSYYCAYCKEINPGPGRQWFSAGGYHALLCKPCVRMMWRDHSKLEDDGLDHHTHNSNFPSYVVNECYGAKWREMYRCFCMVAKFLCTEGNLSPYSLGHHFQTFYNQMQLARNNTIFLAVNHFRSLHLLFWCLYFLGDSSTRSLCI